MRRALVLSLILVSLVLVSAITCLGYGAWHTQKAFAAAQQFDLITAQHHARQAFPIASTLNALTFAQSPDIRIWQKSLELLIVSPQIAESLTQSLTTPDSSASPLSETMKIVGQIQNDLPQTLIIRRVLAEHVLMIEQALSVLTALDETVLSDSYTILVLFQNSHELRATGGFIGSYALITLHQGQLEHIEVQDIYVPDGQFTGFVQAPAGVTEYLSSGRGLRLPDANWWPDFPASAQQVLAYFAVGNQSDIDAVIAMNLEFAQSILDITGDVFIPDYQTTVTAQNIADMLRSNRQEFFPGSIAKQHLLESVFNQVKFRLSELSAKQQKQLAASLIAAIKQKHLQFFANQPELQELFIKHNLAGQMSAMIDKSNQAAWYFFPVESNVGINKANQSIDRQFSIDISSNTSDAALLFTNSNSPSDSDPHYINYQRVYILPGFTINTITINGQPLASWDEEIITTSNGEQFKQVGFLVQIPAKSQTMVTLSLNHPPLPPTSSLKLQKQAGTSPIQYSITTDSQTQELWLDQDTVITID